MKPSAATTNCTQLFSAGGLYTSALYTLLGGIVSMAQAFGPEAPRHRTLAKPGLVDDSIGAPSDEQSTQECCCQGATAQVRPMVPPMPSTSCCPSPGSVCSLTTATQARGADAPAERQPGWCRYDQAPWLHKALVYLFAFALAFEWVIVPVFWLTLFNPATTGYALFKTTLVHSALLYPLMDAALGRLPVLSQLLLNVVYALLVYTFINAMYSAANPGEFLYGILQWQEVGPTIGVILGVSLLTVATWFAMWAAVRSRDIAARAYRAKIGV